MLIRFTILSLVSLSVFVGSSCFALPTTIEGPFQTPESVAYDPKNDLYIVSNINGSPTAKDNNGFISRVSPDGKKIEAKWIAGGVKGVELNAPKGLALFRGELIVSDIDVVRKFDAVTGSFRSKIEIAGARFLNDLAVDDKTGDIFVSDSGFNSDFSLSGAQAIYRIALNGEVAKIVRSDNFGPVNGIAMNSKGGAEVVTFDEPGQIVSFTSKEMGIASGRFPSGQLDGLIILNDGSEIVSSWKGSSLYQRSPNGAVTVLANELEAPADIAFDSKRSVVIVPLFNSNKLVLVPLH